MFWSSSFFVCILRAVSDIPVAGLVAGVRVGCIDGEFVVNPPVPDMARSTLDLVVAGTEDSVLMIEVLYARGNDTAVPGVTRSQRRSNANCAQCFLLRPFIAQGAAA